MAKKRDDTEAMLQAASLPPDEQMTGVLRFLTADLQSDPADWSGFLKGLPRRPCTSASGRLRVEWLAVREPRPLPAAILHDLQLTLRLGLETLLGLSATARAFRGIWNLDMIPPGQLSVMRDSGGCRWLYAHIADAGDEDAPVPGIVLAVAQLVAEHADRIRRCELPGCDVLFLAKDKRQMFCTVTHGQRSRDQRKKKAR